jgi:hypothetical protein
MADFAGQVRRALAAELARCTEWDLPPALRFMTEHGGRVEVLQRNPVPDYIWGALSSPPAVLAYMAANAGRTPLPGYARALAPPPCGIVLVTEGWAVAEPRNPPPAFTRQLRADRNARRLHTRLDRREVRNAHAATTGGQFAACQFRGEPIEILPAALGGVPDSLLTLWRAIEQALR